MAVKTYQKGVATRLTSNFRSTEFDCHGSGCCDVTPISEELVEILQKVRNHFKVSVNVNSGYRCPKHNSDVSGASKTSYHMNGMAADIRVKNVHPVIVARYLETLNVNGRIGCYTYDDSGSGFVHVDVRGKKTRAFYTENNVGYENFDHFHPVIKRGSKGRHVTVVQRRLKTFGLYKSSIDGKCGPAMEKAIIAFNEMHGRENDKAFGPLCWNEAFPIE